MPDNAALRARILSRARPRSLPPSFTPHAAWSAAKKRDLNGNAPFAKWSGPAPKQGVTEDHGAFYLKNDGATVAEFLVLLDVGCKRPRVSVDRSGSRRVVKVGGQAIGFD